MWSRFIVLIPILLGVLFAWIVMVLLSSFIDYFDNYTHYEFFLGCFVLGAFISFFNLDPPGHLADETLIYQYYESQWDEKIQMIIEEKEIQKSKKLRDELEKEIDHSKTLMKVHIYIKKIFIIVGGFLVFILNSHFAYVVVLGFSMGWIIVRIRPLDKSSYQNFFDTFPKRPYFIRKTERVYDSKDELHKKFKPQLLPRYTVTLRWTLDGSLHRYKARAINKDQAIGVALSEFATFVDKTDIEVVSVSLDE